jgi:hypothetical protein
MYIEAATFQCLPTHVTHFEYHEDHSSADQDHVHHTWKIDEYSSFFSIHTRVLAAGTMSAAFCDNTPRAVKTQARATTQKQMIQTDTTTVYLMWKISCSYTDIYKKEGRCFNIFN